MLVLTILYWVWISFCLVTIGISNLAVSLIVTRIPDVLQKASENLEKHEQLTDDDREKIRTAIANGEVESRLQKISLSCAIRFALMVLSALFLWGITTTQDNALGLVTYSLTILYMLWDSISMTRKTASMNLFNIMYIWVIVAVSFKFVGEIHAF